MKKIFVYLKEPGRKARHVWISASLENLQKTVGGYIETVNVRILGHGEVLIICNEEGLLKRLLPNVTIGNHSFVGTIIVAGQQGEEIGDCPLEIGEMKRYFPQLFKEG